MADESKQGAAATKIQGKARQKKAKADMAAKRASNPEVKSVFELFDTDHSGRLSALEFCSGIEVILERAETVAQKQAVQDFISHSSKLWDLMSEDAGWGAHIPVTQLPHCTPELWAKYLEANGGNEKAFLDFAATFFKKAHQLKRRLLSEAIKRRAMKRLEQSVREMDLFDLIDFDKSGALSVQEMENTLNVLKKDHAVDTSLWTGLQVELYLRLSTSAGWGQLGAMNPNQLPHMTREIFEEHMTVHAEKLAPFVAAVKAVMPKSAEIQEACKKRVQLGL